MEAAVGGIWCHNKTKKGLQLESNQVTVAGGEGNNNRSRQHLGQASSRILEDLRQSVKKKTNSLGTEVDDNKTSLKFRCRWQQQEL